ncbi:tripartite-type tricarboxylate transporter receptor subunit TctC [Bradyrhizobium sp. LM2.7]
MKITALTVALGLLGLISGNSIAQAQAVYPEKSLQLIVPFPPGGASDVVARIIGGELETRLGKPVVIMNRPGGGTTIAAKEVARSAPDGYTLFFSSNSSFTLPAAVKESVPYDAAKDFEPLGRVGKITLVLVTYKDNPITDVASLVAEAKANPDKLSLASFGVATVSHFAGELFKSSAGIKMVHLPYKGSAPAMNDLIGKHIQYHVDTVIAVKPQIEAGTVRVLAVFSAKRTPFLPRRADARRTRLCRHRLLVVGCRGHPQGPDGGRSRQAVGSPGGDNQQSHRRRALRQGRLRAKLRALQRLGGSDRQGSR